MANLAGAWGLFWQERGGGASGSSVLEGEREIENTRVRTVTGGSRSCGRRRQHGEVGKPRLGDDETGVQEASACPDFLGPCL